MWWYYLGALVAGVGALVHVRFAYVETAGWNLAAVRKIAPSWVAGMSDTEADRVIAWAKRLAFNIGIYNLVLALGLAWTCRAFALQAPTAKSLGIFFAVWLLGAAAAAISTQIVKAFVVQGALGVLLLLAALCI
jgi:uncharacterized membrane protein